MADLDVPVIIVSGPPGAGKTTIAGALARQYALAVHLHTDDFWRAVVSGGIAPYEAAARQQNHVVLDVAAGAACTYADGGFTTVVDGVVGPWMLDHYVDRSRRHPDLPLHYVVLRPDRETTLRRAQQRTGTDALTDPTALLSMWDQFADLGALEAHVLDTSRLDPGDSLRLVAEGIESGRFLLDRPV